MNKYKVEVRLERTEYCTIVRYVTAASPHWAEEMARDEVGDALCSDGLADCPAPEDWSVDDDGIGVSDCEAELVEDAR